MKDRDWAAAYYRVERETAGIHASRRKLKKMADAAARHGDPVPVGSRDLIRIYDRAGNIVFERDWGSNRPAAQQEEARIVDDLLRLDLMTFRARYMIPPDDPVPKGSDEAGGATPDEVDEPPAEGGGEGEAKENLEGTSG